MVSRQHWHGEHMPGLKHANMSTTNRLHPREAQRQHSGQRGQREVPPKPTDLHSCSAFSGFRTQSPCTLPPATLAHAPLHLQLQYPNIVCCRNSYPEAFKLSAHLGVASYSIYADVKHLSGLFPGCWIWMPFPI